MAILSFTLSPDAILRVHDALICLGKFSEAVCIEVNRSHLTLSALNSSKSAYASISLASSYFFEKYYYTPILARGQSIEDSKFTCKIHNKALLSAFKGRVSDPLKERDTAIERCDGSIEDGKTGTKSRLIIKMVCRHGVLKTYRLTFEYIAAMHAVFDAKIAKNKWSISSRTLREFAEHFGPGTEQLDMCADGGRVSFLSYTEKIVANNEILKQPLQTTVAIDTLEFLEFLVEQKLHIVISVKDFKAIVAHAGILNTVVSAIYSEPSRPMQISYGENGILSEFILMTIGESRGSSVIPGPSAARTGSVRARVSTEASPSRASKSGSAGHSITMPPPPRSAAPSICRESQRARISKPSPEPPQPSLSENEMFFPDTRPKDDDRRWDPVGEEEEDEDMLLWDASINNNTDDTSHRLRDESNSNPANRGNRRDIHIHPEATQRVAPTQKISQVQGLFDD